jgi:hypothetical protein
VAVCVCDSGPAHTKHISDNQILNSRTPGDSYRPHSEDLPIDLGMIAFNAKYVVVQKPPDTTPAIAILDPTTSQDADSQTWAKAPHQQVLVAHEAKTF